jgi:hypothetical protein
LDGLDKITIVAQIYVGSPFRQCISYSICILTKNGLGHILGEFFSNSTGYPGYYPNNNSIVFFKRKSGEIGQNY